ncbi:MAG TPA: STAS domain-containing protein [Candidatus Binatia bacterium]
MLKKIDNRNGAKKTMLRITENLANGDAIRLRLDGTITTESYAELDKAVSRYHDGARRMIILDMAGVSFMNDESAGKLVRIKSENVRIINCSPFIAALLDAVERAD